MRNTETKKDIREKYRKIRQEIPEDQRKAAEEKITENLLSLPEYEEARFIYCYVSIDDEADTRRIIAESLRRGKKVAAPRVRGKQRMEFCLIKSLADLRPGFLSIQEPGPWCKKAAPPYEETLVILPGTAFDRRGGRIGYGGGYYDAYLEGKDRCRKAALAFHAQISENVPADSHDVRADIIVTEEEIIRCTQDCPETR